MSEGIILGPRFTSYDLRIQYLNKQTTDLENKLTAEREKSRKIIGTVENLLDEINGAFCGINQDMLDEIKKRPRIFAAFWNVKEALREYRGQP